MKRTYHEHDELTRASKPRLDVRCTQFRFYQRQAFLAGLRKSGLIASRPPERAPPTRSVCRRARSRRICASCYLAVSLNFDLGR